MSARFADRNSFPRCLPDGALAHAPVDTINPTIRTTGPAAIMKSFLQRRLLDTTRHTLAGLRAAWRSEEAFRVEVALGLMLLPLAMWLGRTGVERALLVGSLFVVLIAELLNTGIEKAVDRVSQETHDLSKFAKDAGSAAVGLALIQCVIVWLVVLLDRFQIS